MPAGSSKNAQPDGMLLEDSDTDEFDSNTGREIINKKTYSPLFSLLKIWRRRENIRFAVDSVGTTLGAF